MNINTLMESPTFTYFTILILCIYIYRSVFAKTQRLPILKTALVYFMLAVGCIMLNFFQLKGLPIIQSLLVAVAMMFVVWLRRAMSKNKTSKNNVS
jgi:hypothetical protein